MAPDVRNINSRRDFNEFFDDALQGANRALGDDLKFEYGQNLPKAYVMEFHPRRDRDMTRQGAIQAFQSLPDMEVRQTIDQTLVSLSGAGVTFFVDLIDTRFIVLHTLDDSTTADTFVDQALVGSSPAFDRAWYSQGFLESVAYAAPVFEGWETRFHRYSYQKGGDDANRLPESFSVSETGMTALSDYETCKMAFDGKDVALDAVLLRLTSSGSYGRARVKSDGKITARGNSFQCFLNLVTLVQGRYTQYVQRLEERYSLTYTQTSTGFRLKGQPFWVRFAKPVEGLQDFLAFMFSCARPFRLMGSPVWVNPSFARIRAVDLHVGKTINFEATPDYMRIYLPQGSCGNSLARIVSELQRHLDSRLVTSEHAALASTNG